MKTKIKLGRFIVPSILLFPFLQSLYLCPFPLPWIVCSECPVFSCLMNPKTTPIRRVLLVNVLVSGFLVGRAFCSWACPFGALQETGSSFAGKLGGISPLRRGLRIVKVFLVLFTFLTAFSLAYPILLSFLPQLLDLSFMLNPIYAVGVTLNSFILTVPWIIGLLRAFIFTFFLGLSIFWRRTWCKICPLGTVISLFNKVSLIGLEVDRDKCDGCNRCSTACQMSLKPLHNGLRSVDCIRCLDCVQECGASAIEVKPRFLKSPSSTLRVLGVKLKNGRRNFLKFAFLTAFAGLISLMAFLLLKPHLARFLPEHEPKGGVKVVGDKVKLPPPKLRGEMSVEEAISRRRSRREYLGEPIKVEELSNLLWAAQGITDPVNEFRAAPSAGATYPLEVYVAIGADGVEELREGVYHYNPSEQVLEKHMEGDLSEELCSAAVSQRWVREAPINIILASIYERTTGRYGERGIRYIHMEAGHVGENIYLQAESLGLGTVVIGAFSDEWVQRLLKLPENQKPVYIIPVGRLTHS